MVKGISVVIPNYNGAHLFGDTLPTVIQVLAALDLPSEVIIVDDCSTDNSLLLLQKNYPDIKVLVNPKNSGFSVSSNKGIAAAIHDKVLLLNSDVKLTPDYFNHQFKYFERPDTFGVMSRIEGWSDNKIQDGAKLPSFHGAKLKTSANYLLTEEKQMEDGLYTMYLSGANAFLDKDKFLLLGGFNTLFSPFYSEDVDLSLRAWRLGFKCYYDYNSLCRHQVSTSIRAKAKKEYVQTIYDRNKMILNALHLEGTARFLWYLQLIPETIGRLLSLRWHYVRSLQMFVKARQEIKKSRVALDELAKLLGCRKTVREVAHLISSNIPGKKIDF